MECVAGFTVMWFFLRKTLFMARGYKKLGSSFTVAPLYRLEIGNMWRPNTCALKRDEFFRTVFGEKQQN